MGEVFMPKGRKFKALLISIGYCALIGLGAKVGLSEMRALRDVQTVSPQLRLMENPEPLAVGYGYRSVGQTITTCFEGLTAINSFYPTSVRHSTAEVCRKTAEEILKDRPTHAAARQLLAESYWRLGLQKEAAEALRKAALTSPNTNWLQQRQLLLLSQLDESSRAYAFPDSSGPDSSGPDLGALIEKLISVPQSRDWLAATYVAQPAMRAIVEDGARALPAQKARSFLARVKALSQLAAEQAQ